MSRTHFAEFERFDEEQTPVTVEFSVSGGSPGSAPSLSHPGEPGEGSEVVIIAAWVEGPDGKTVDVKLTAAEDEAFTDRLIERIGSGDYDDCPEPEY